MKLYVYELAKNLIKQNCDVTIMSQIGGPLTDMAKRIGIKCVSFEEAPGFKLGDGKWGFNTEEGFKPSTENVLYRVSEVNFDIIHMQHKPVASCLALSKTFAASWASFWDFSFSVKISDAGPTNSTYFLCSAVASSRAFNFVWYTAGLDTTVSKSKS